MNLRIPILLEKEFNLISFLTKIAVDIIHSVVYKSNIAKKYKKRIYETLIINFEIIDLFIGKRAYYNAYKDSIISFNQMLKNEIKKISKKLFDLGSNYNILKKIFIQAHDELNNNNNLEKQWNHFKNDVLSYFQLIKEKKSKVCKKSIKLFELSKIRTKNQFDIFLKENGPILVSFKVPNSENYLALCLNGPNIGNLATFNKKSELITKQKKIGKYYMAIEKNEVISLNYNHIIYRLSSHWEISDWKSFQNYWIRQFKMKLYKSIQNK